MVAMNEMEQVLNNNSTFFVRQNGVLQKLDWQEIYYIHADGNYCYLHTANKKFAVKISMRKLYERLEAFGFARVHKSYIVQSYYIDHIDTNNNSLNLGEVEIPIGRAFKKDLLDKVDIL